MGVYFFTNINPTFYFNSLIQLHMCAGYPAWPMTGDQSGTDEIFMAAQEAVGAATGQQRDSQGRHEWLTRFIIIMVFTMALVQKSLNY